MTSLIKWIYDLGKMHERRRIELAIKNYHHVVKMDSIINSFDVSERERNDMEIRRKEFEDAIKGILNPTYTEITERSILDD